MQAHDIARALDPAQILVDAGIEPDDWQRAALAAPGDVLMLCGRQTGKSTTAAAKSIHVANYVAPGLPVLLASRSERQSGELFRTVLAMYDRLDGMPALKTRNRLSMELQNGARVIAVPGNESTVRGLASVSAIVCDEAARIDDEIMSAIRPMAAVTNAPIWALSSAWFKRGWFYNRWCSSRDVTRFEYRSTECSRIDSEWLEKERRETSPWIFEREYECIWADVEAALFPGAIVDALGKNLWGPLVL